MKSLATVTSAALMLSLAAPALASKPVRPSDSSVKKNDRDTPRGIEVAQSKASDKAGHGHGNDVPRGNGNGYGHNHHDHGVSPD